MSIVSTGTAGAVSRRIDVSFKATTVRQRAFDDEGLIGQGGITLDNNADIRVGIGTNGNVDVRDNANICGNIRHGVGKKRPPATTGPVQRIHGHRGQRDLPAVSTFIPTDIATNNSNYRLVKCTCANNPVGCQTDTYKKHLDSKHRSLERNTGDHPPSSNASLTLGGGDYFICSALAQQQLASEHRPPAPRCGSSSTPRRIADSPPGPTQIDISGNADITATGYQPSHRPVQRARLLPAGLADDPRPDASWGNNAGNDEFVLYAPEQRHQHQRQRDLHRRDRGQNDRASSENAIDQSSDPQASSRRRSAARASTQRQSYVECTRGHRVAAQRQLLSRTGCGERRCPPLKVRRTSCRAK